MSEFIEPLPEQQRDMAVRLAWSLLWTPYVWGGDDFSGRDCSGMYVEILAAVGVIDRGRDYSAAGLYELFRSANSLEPYRGRLVFWRNGAGRVIHVEMLVDAFWTIGASGGGRPKFNLYSEIQKDPLLKKYYGHLSEDDLERRRGDFVIDLIKRELYRKQAIEQNAFVKPNLLNYRGDNYVICDPFVDE